MSHCFHGACSCRKTQLSLTLPHPLTCYAPRVCDCDFCVSRGINWLSDPKGSLEVSSSHPLVGLQQGSNQAVFHACSECDTVVAVTLETDNTSLAAVNALMLADKALLKDPQTVSPQRLSGDRKKARWGKIWMPVRFTD